MYLIKFLLIITIGGSIFIFSQKPLKYAAGEIISNQLSGLISIFYKRPWVDFVEVVSFSGRAFYIEDNTLIPVEKNQKIKKLFTLQTEAEGWILLKFGRNSLLKLLPNSTLKIKFNEHDTPIFQLPFGSAFVSLSKEEKNVKVMTPFAHLQGTTTDYLVRSGQHGKTIVSVLDGHVISEVTWNTNLLIVHSGEGTAIDMKGNTLNPAAYDWVKKIDWNEIADHVYVDDYAWKLRAFKKYNPVKLSPFEFKTFPFVTKLSERIKSSTEELDQYLQSRKYDGPQEKDDTDITQEAQKSARKMNEYYRRLERDFNEN